MGLREDYGPLLGLAGDLGAILRHDPTDFDPLRPRRPDTGYRRLAAGVLAQAVADLDLLRRWLGGPPRGGTLFNDQQVSEAMVRQWYMRTRAWFLSDDERHLFSLRPICDALEINVEAVQAVVARECPPLDVGQPIRRIRKGAVAKALWQWASARQEPWTMTEAGAAIGVTSAVVQQALRRWRPYGLIEVIRPARARQPGLYRLIRRRDVA